MEVNDLVLLVVGVALAPVVGTLARGIPFPRTNRALMIAYGLTVCSYALSVAETYVPALSIAQQASYAAAAVGYAAAAWELRREVLAWEDGDR